MIILGLNRCNLSRKNPLYNVFLANCNKQVIYEASAINRNKLKKIVNLNTIDELAVFSDQEFKIIKNLTNRNIIILTKWLNTNFGPIKINRILEQILSYYRLVLQNSVQTPKGLNLNINTHHLNLSKMQMVKLI